jgi:hypothetical protein
VKGGVWCAVSARRNVVPVYKIHAILAGSTMIGKLRAESKGQISENIPL